ncbi:hypothetical protein, partial [Methylobacterium sp. CM6247]
GFPEDAHYPSSGESRSPPAGGGVTTIAKTFTDPLILSLQRALDEAQQRQDTQIAVIASLAGQEKEQAEARQVLRLIETTLLQAQQSHAIVKFLAEPE